LKIIIGDNTGDCTMQVMFTVEQAPRRCKLLVFLAMTLAGLCLVAAPLSVATSGLGISNVKNTNVAAGASAQQENRTYNLIFIAHPTVTMLSLQVGPEVTGTINVVVDEIESRPAGVADPPLSPVRTYISINVGETRVENAAIRFKVPRSWVEQNNIDEQTIKLLRLNGEWKDLPTSLVGSDDLYLYFEARTPGFSLFAVAGVSKGPVGGPPIALLAAVIMVAVAGAFSAVYWFRIRPMKPFVQVRRLRREVLGQKTRRPESEQEAAERIRRLRRSTKIKRAYESAPLEEVERGVPKRKRFIDEREVELVKRLRRKMKGKS